MTAGDPSTPRAAEAAAPAPPAVRAQTQTVTMSAADLGLPAGGSVTVTATVILNATGEYISSSKTLTILRLGLSVDGTAASWNPNALGAAGTEHTLSVSLQGASGTCTYDWTTSDSGVISLSPTNDASITARCGASGNSTITVTVHYGGNDYTGSKMLMVP